jgi:hypothetical protein
VKASGGIENVLVPVKLGIVSRDAGFVVSTMVYPTLSDLVLKMPQLAFLYSTTGAPIPKADVF